MADSRRFLRVFLASPGDLGEERQAAREEVDEYNKIWAEHLGYQVELVRWEDAVSRSGRPQGIINEELDRCELFIGMLYQRWGTPPDTDGTYGSGFEEEFRTSAGRRLRTGKPEIKMLFKEVEPERIADPGPELSKVLDFRRELIDEKKFYFETFGNQIDFRARFRGCLHRYVQSLRLSPIEREEADSRPKATEPDDQVRAEPSAETPLSSEGAAFLRSLLDAPSADGAISATAVARMRLIANMVGGTQNDDEWLEAHDANLIYASRRDLALSSSEHFALTTAGLAAFDAENTPLWFWLRELRAFDNVRLTYRTFGSAASAPRLGALAVITLLGLSLPDEPPLDRLAFLRTWFSEEAPDAIRLAALKYLGEWGTTADLQMVRAELTRDAYSTRTQALEALLRVLLRDSAEVALKELVALQPERVSSKVLQELFSRVDACSDALLSQSLSHRNANVRRRALQELGKRRAINLDVAMQMLADADAEVRFDAIRIARSLGKEIGGEEAKKLLTPPRNFFRGGLIGAIGQPAEADRRHLEILERDELLVLLRKKGAAVPKLDVLNPVGFFTYAERNFASCGDQVRRALENQYDQVFSAYAAEMEGVFGSAKPDLLEKIRNLEAHVRADLSTRALSVLSTKGVGRDIGLIRQTIETVELQYCEEPVAFLQKHGEWQDIDRIAKWADKVPSGMGLMTYDPNPKWDIAARAIHEIGKDRLSELILWPFRAELLTRLIALASDTQFRRLTDMTIDALFGNENQAVRRAICLKCVKALPKVRVSSLLDRYVQYDGHHYYNVIFWLDLGASAPGHLAKTAATRLLSSSD